MLVLMAIATKMQYFSFQGILYDVESGECDKSNLDKNPIQHMSCIPGGYI